MKPIPNAITLAFATLALAAAPTLAADGKSARADPPGFNALDRDGDGHVSRAEAARNPNLAKRFEKADDDKDGRLSRAEYLEVMAARDFRSLREELADFVEPGGDEKDRKGFNELDRNGDGKLSRAEAQASRELASRFAESDDDKDGFVTRVEYLKTMAAIDWQNARENMAEFIRPDSSAGASAGGARKK